MTLHDAIVIVLRENGAPMTAPEIAAEINGRELYVQRKGTPVPSTQIHARVSKYPHLFTRSGDGRIGLMEWDEASPC